MATTERASRMRDHVSAEMVDCTPPEPVRATVPLPSPPTSTPIRESATATVEQTGADPPPEG